MAVKFGLLFLSPMVGAAGTGRHYGLLFLSPMGSSAPPNGISLAVTETADRVLMGATVSSHITLATTESPDTFYAEVNYATANLAGTERPDVFTAGQLHIGSDIGFAVFETPDGFSGAVRAITYTYANPIMVPAEDRTIDVLAVKAPEPIQ